MSESLMYGAIIAVAAVVLVLIGLFFGYHHATLVAQKCKLEDDEVFAYQLQQPPPAEPSQTTERASSSTLVKRPVTTATRAPPILTL